MGQDFSLGDLLRLQLHVHAEACAEIVDRAQKEQVIEKALLKISDTWNAMQLTFTPYKVCPQRTQAIHVMHQQALRCCMFWVTCAFKTTVNPKPPDAGRQ